MKPKSDAAARTIAEPQTEIAREYSHGEDDEWDDTSTALFLRAFFTFFSGAFLLFCVMRAPLFSYDAARVAQCYALAFLFLPLGIVWLFFAQTIRRVDYLKNQALNAWNYGWNFPFSRNKPDTQLSLPARVLASPFLSALALCIVIFPLLLLAHHNDARALQFALFPVNASTHSVSWLPFLLLTAFCREWFFRGFLLFGIAQGFRGVAAPIVAIFLQATLFACAHGNTSGAIFNAFNIAFFAVGIVFGALAWKQKSFAAPFCAHAFALIIGVLLMN
jgi:hypothetical protein